ncbi:hypothetical protein LshimejAT787_0404500 [Lyophyllum shimeji]|uniref:Uncharacterized protein n=1 Tax=Lyophyllum shimeji TaxID=47721 RepID=A0A9P3PL10_LYOSH|nr:hypothetical protein LshimejAT787_0404500 [Lyophyllum shimeji]
MDVLKNCRHPRNPHYRYEFRSTATAQSSEDTFATTRARKHGDGLRPTSGCDTQRARGTNQNPRCSLEPTVRPRLAIIPLSLQLSGINASLASPAFRAAKMSMGWIQ